VIPAPRQEHSPSASAAARGVSESLNRLIAALREELQQYGELLALLDRPQDLTGVSPSGELLQSIAAIQNQAAVIESARADRDRCHGAVATALEQSSTVPFAVLIPLLPADYQPLVEALVLENNQLLLRVQQRAHQNHVLMSRSAALMQQFVSALPTLRESDTTLARRPASVRPLPFLVTSQFEVVG
jgi:hypothetical protein